MTDSPKLSEILELYENGQNPHQSEEYRLTKAQTALNAYYLSVFLEIVGPDNKYYKDGKTDDGYNIQLNYYKAELRTALKERLSYE